MPIWLSNQVEALVGTHCILHEAAESSGAKKRKIAAMPCKNWDLVRVFLRARIETDCRCLSGTGIEGQFLLSIAFLY